MKIIRPNIHGLDHKAVATQFGLKLEFLGCFPTNKDNRPKSVYRILDAKGDKEFFVLDLDFHNNKVYKNHVTKEALSSKAKVDALHCLTCDTVIYSTEHHDWRQCGCKGEKYCFVDGGQTDYFRYGGSDSTFEVGKLDLIKGTFKIAKEKNDE